MPGIVALINAISTHVVAGLAAASLPALTDGKILLGRQHVRASSAPPRIVMIPTGGKYGPKSVTSASNAGAATELALERLQRAIATEIVSFEVHVWGDDPDEPAATRPDVAYDVTQELAQQVIRSVHELTVGRYTLSDGRWTDSANGGSELVTLGREYVFGIALATPVLAKALEYAPADVAPLPTTNLQPADGGTPSVGCTG